MSSQRVSSGGAGVRTRDHLTCLYCAPCCVGELGGEGRRSRKMGTRGSAEVKGRITLLDTVRSGRGGRGGGGGEKSRKRRGGGSGGEGCFRDAKIPPANMGRRPEELTARVVWTKTARFSMRI